MFLELSRCPPLFPLLSFLCVLFRLGACAPVRLCSEVAFLSITRSIHRTDTKAS